MRVLFVTGEFPPMQGGVGDYSALLARALREQGAEVSVLTSARASKKQMTAEDARWTLPIMRNWGTNCWRTILQAASERKADIVHVQYQTAAFGMNPAINLLPWAARLRGRHRPRVFVTFHDLKPPYLFPKAGPVRRLPAAVLATGADGVVVTNEEDATALAKTPGITTSAAAKSGRRRVHLIPIGSNIPVVPVKQEDIQDWRVELGIEPSALLLSFFGFLNQNKGIDLLLEALAALSQRGLPINLLMIGGAAGDSDTSSRAYAHKIRAITDSPGLRRCVYWTGFTRPEEVSRNLSRTDVCVLPFREGGSYRHGTLVAALVHGLPIVTTPTAPAVASEFTDGFPRLRHLENCFLIPAGDVRPLAGAIEQLAGDSQLRQRLSQGSRELAPYFQWNRIAQSTLTMYEQIE